MNMSSRFIIIFCSIILFCCGCVNFDKHDIETDKISLASDFQVFLQGDLSSKTALDLSKGSNKFPCESAKIKNDGNFIDFAKLAKVDKITHRQAGIMLAQIHAEKEQLIYLGIGADWYFELYLNGELIYNCSQGNLFAVAKNNYKIPLKVKKGENLLALRVLSGSKGWGIFCNIVQNEVALSHIPWVVKSDIGSATINFMTNKAMAAFLEYRKEGEAGWIRLKNSKTGLLRTDTNLHVFELNNLLEDTVYEFRAVLAPDRHFNFEYPQKIYRFRSLGHKKDNYKLFLVGDTQIDSEDLKKTWDNFKKNTEINNCDFFVHIGDTANFIGNAEEQLLTSTLDILQSERELLPNLIMVRGNHEYLGNEALKFVDFFGGKNGKNYYSFQAGKVFFIVLDSGCDHAYSKVKYHPFYAYLDDDALIQEQRNFLREVVKKTDFQNSEFRVVLSHAPGVIPSRMTDTINKICNGILWGEDIDNQIDLYVAGHTHRYCRSVQKGSNAQRAFCREGILPLNDKTNKLIYIVNDGPYTGKGLDISGILFSFSNGKITVEAMDVNGKIFDHFEIDKTGKITEIYTEIPLFTEGGIEK